MGYWLRFRTGLADGEPALRVFVVLSPMQQGYARGSGAPFVLPVSKNYKAGPPCPMKPGGAFPNLR